VGGHADKQLEDGVKWSVGRQVEHLVSEMQVKQEYGH